ncbi:MAG: flagellar hook assembly protein FlgD [Beijerinckiaceae bacterium]
MATISNATTPTFVSGGTTTLNNSALANNFQSFLTLLTTQLKNQNPLEPLNTNEFTQQLVQFASVEQQLKMNDTLGSLLALNKTNTMTNALNFVGKTVTADGSTTKLSNGSAEWRINLPRTAREVAITIKDKDGNVVFTESKPMTAGTNTYLWNGKNSTGALASDGDYTLTATAIDTSGQGMTAKTELSGIVDGVDLSSGTPLIRIGTLQVAMDRVTSISR